MKAKLIKFAVFKNQMFGEEVRAKDFDDLLNNRMTKRQRKFWSNVKFTDSKGRNINISREFLEEQRMTFDEIVDDFIEHCSEQFEDAIYVV